MTKQDLVNAVDRAVNADRPGRDDITKSDIEAVINAAFTEIGAAVARGEWYVHHGFGSFKAVRRAGRMGRNPRTKEAMSIPAKDVVRFSPAGALKLAVADTMIVEE